MKLTPVFLLTIFTGGVAFAAPPGRSKSLKDYEVLYTKSAITDPPEVITNDPEPENLPDWILVAVSKYVGKTEVEVMNIKDRTRIRIPSPEATEMGFAIKEVKQFRNFIEETVVTLKKGKETGEVRFDPKFLVLKKVAGPTTNKAKPASSKTAPSKTNRPPIPGKPSVPGRPTSSNSKSDKRGRPSTGSRVPLPSTSSSSTKSSGSTSKPRVRYVPRK